MLSNSCFHPLGPLFALLGPLGLIQQVDKKLYKILEIRETGEKMMETKTDLNSVTL